MGLGGLCSVGGGGGGDGTEVALALLTPAAPGSILRSTQTHLVVMQGIFTNAVSGEGLKNKNYKKTYVR